MLFDVGGYLVNWSMGLPMPEGQYRCGFPSWHLTNAHHSSCAIVHSCGHEHMRVWMSVFRRVQAYYLLISQVDCTSVDYNHKNQNVFHGVNVGRVNKWAMLFVIPYSSISSLTTEATWISPSGSIHTVAFWKCSSDSNLRVSQVEF